MGAYAASEGLIPGIVFCSTSERTRQTIARFEEGLGRDLAVEYTEALYMASAGTILEAIRRAPEDAASVMIVAHNPGTHAAAQQFIKTAAPEDVENLDYNFPTAAFAEYRFDADAWADVDFGRGEMIRFILPRRL